VCALHRELDRVENPVDDEERQGTLEQGLDVLERE
jgi:hypothetical protein